jgi:hypothetical protein
MCNAADVLQGLITLQAEQYKEREHVKLHN